MSGVLAELVLSHDALDLGPDKLAALILETSRLAGRDAAEQALALAGAEFGEASVYTAHLRSELDERLR